MSNLNNKIYTKKDIFFKTLIITLKSLSIDS